MSPAPSSRAFFPGTDHGRVNVEPLGQLGGGFFVFNGGQGYLGLECGTVFSAFVAHVSSFQFWLTHSLTHCPDFGDHRPFNFTTKSPEK